MSINFSQTLSLIERNCKLGNGRISGNVNLLSDFTADINLALDFVYATIFDCGGKWQFDDSNHTDYPIITTNLVANQRDYSFVSDEAGNLILDIYKVMIKDPNGVYVEITPVDQQSDEDMASFYNGLNTTGTPTRYDKTANGIFLDVIPSYNSTGGLKIFINREGSYFLTSDTTKKAGFAGLYHEYLALRPSYQYAYRNNLSNIQAIQNEMLIMEDKIKKHYGKRERDVKRRLIANVEDNH